MRRRRWNTILALGLCVSLAVPATSWAAAPNAEKVDGGYDAETWAKLQDNVMEYDELPLLVHEFNSDMVFTRKKLADAEHDLEQNVNDLLSGKRRMESLKDSAKDAGEIQEMIGYATQEKILEITANAMNSALLSISGSRSTIRSLQKAENQLVNAAQSLMITYNSASCQKETLEQLAKLYDAQYELAVNKQAQGMATEAEVLKAQKNQLSAKSNLMALEGGLMKIKPILCYLTGWPADGDPEIAPIPAIDFAEIGSWNLEEDTVKAIGNNQTLIAQRTSAAGKTNDGVKTRLNMINEGDEKLTIEMKRLYEDVLAKKTAYEAAQTGLQSAEKSRDSYDRMYQQGMLSRSDYIGAQMTYYQKKAAFEGADLELRKAINAYQWGVKGFATVSD